MEKVQLYSYFRSSAAYRVRIALYLKNIPFEYIPVHLLKDGGEQFSEAYKALNPAAEVPTFAHNGRVISQSMAILEYIDSVWPQAPLFPLAPYEKAKVIQICETVNSGIHPVQNLKVLKELEARFNLTLDEKTQWAAYWIQHGFVGLEKILQSTAGTYCFGGQITAADLFVAPQVYNARRFQVDMTQFPTIERIYKNCLCHSAFQKASPERQPDSPQP